MLIINDYTMKHIIKRFLIFIVLATIGCIGYAQKIKKVSATYIYYAPENVSVEKAKFTALERAKIQAIADEFGTIVSQTNTTHTKSKNGEVETDFTSLGESFVKGEWIETIGTPEITVSYEQNMLIVKCSIKGRAREITTVQTNFSAKILCNGTEARFEQEEFKHGDRLYLSFQTPTDGYLAVYLIDAENNANCLLPYPTDSDGQMPVKHGTDYIFFSTKHAVNNDYTVIDEYILTCEGESEFNQVYILFSPNPFTKAVDQGNNKGLPRFLPFSKFLEWLANCRKLDSQLGVNVKTIHIKK